MTSSLLPGFREARSDLVAGGLILAILWLIFGDSAASVFYADASPTLRSLLDLRNGTAGWFLLLGGAYLVGSIWTSFLERLRFGSWHRHLGREDWDQTTLRFGPRRLLERLRLPFSLRSITRFRSVLKQEVSGLRETDGLTREGFEWLLRTVIRESILIAPALNYEHANAFNEYSRTKSEGEFRDAIALPIAILGTVIAVESSASLSVSGFVVAASCAIGFASFMQGRLLTQNANSQLLHAVAAGEVATPTLDLLRRDMITVDDLAGRWTEPPHLESIAAVLRERSISTAPLEAEQPPSNDAGMGDSDRRTT